ncbi:MAG: bifunctional UDP-N-acetylmuramoyl-tripeptide:D-alanyl-D-alanine ligase/alanine racemase, partial [Muribaculaceae bacterium]|nr:bifunctional UDP-N-acetylmuramoyl-tripeptide:D-alanyl-D-alanine ligase/alanine racemase [Muribaculaceae bacterium]
GKTTVKEWIYQLLQAEYNIVRSPRSYNSQIGVPLSLWEMDADTRMAVFEAGISQSGEMNVLQTLISPTLGVITNVGNEHSDGFESLRRKCEEKVLLLQNCDCIIYNGDDELISDVVSRCFQSVKKISWSCRNDNYPLFISSIIKQEDGSTCINYRYLNHNGVFSIPFFADSDIENAIHCLAVMLYLGCSTDIIAMRMSRLTEVGTRLNVIEGVNQCMLVYDSYTSDLHSLAPALDFMTRRATTDRSMTVILSDVMHETMESSRLYEAIAQLLKHKGIERVIGIGKEITRHRRYFDANATFYSSTSDFLESVTTSDFDHELILIKGASQFHFERLRNVLEASQHETVLEVNLDAVVHNFNKYRSLVKPTTGIVAMVKASGYGAGSYELAKTLQSQGAAYLAVAVLDEGVDLRKAGITMPIMVLNPKVVNYKTLFSYRLEPEIYSFDILDEIIKEAEKYGISDYPVHIKLDTGMHRLGFLEDDIPQLLATLAGQTAIKPKSVFSHLATADCPDMDDYTLMQFDSFDRCCEKLQGGLNYRILRHILNSTGITRYPEHQYDMVRLGICLYGIPTMNDGSQDDLLPVSSLHTIICAIKEWPSGTTIGYGRKGVLYRNSRVATIPIGYADGLNRHLGNGKASVWINGARCP